MTLTDSNSTPFID